ncbi:hypothetical protein [Heyndrickxia camelliae]|uniref:hypothetical protein n=1 Tax=Heyndrickxia camelliae TaxID=1707093 RepID=UPI00130334FF|nr:hypothetical protein [Heyndrickxia camelliae]
MVGNFALVLSMIMTFFLFYYVVMEMKREKSPVLSLHILLVVVMAFVFSGLAYIFI